jgi:hypothetical protein
MGETPPSFRMTIPVLLSFNGAYVDTAGILPKLLALRHVVFRAGALDCLEWVMKFKQSKTDTTHLDARRRQ